MCNILRLYFLPFLYLNLNQHPRCMRILHIVKHKYRKILRLTFSFFLYNIFVKFRIIINRIPFSWATCFSLSPLILHHVHIVFHFSRNIKLKSSSIFNSIFRISFALPLSLSLQSDNSVIHHVCISIVLFLRVSMCLKHNKAPTYLYLSLANFTILSLPPSFSLCLCLSLSLCTLDGHKSESPVVSDNETVSHFVALRETRKERELRLGTGVNSAAFSAT